MKRFITFRFLGLTAVLLILVVIAILPLAQTGKWVGHRDLMVNFVVTDSDTGVPIPEATIQIQAKGRGFCDQDEQPEFSLTTDADGVATRLSTNCMCYGSRGAFENTFATHVPPWTFQVYANGYLAFEDTWLDGGDYKYSRHVQRSYPVATMQVPIQLQKRPE